MGDMWDSGLEVRAVTPEDVEGLLALIRVCLGPGSVPRTREFLEWKHLLGPFGPSPGLVAATHGEIIALRLFLRWRFERAGTVWEAVRPVDTAVHPKWRSRGLFTGLTLALVDVARGLGCSFAFNTPNRNSRRGYLRMGWETLGRAPLLGRLRRPHRLLVCGGDSTSTRRASPRRQGSASVCDLLEVLRERESSAATGSSGNRMRTPKDLGYLKWRYSDIPGLEYSADWECSGGSCAAVIFRTRSRSGRRELSIAELLVGDGRNGATTAARLLERVADATDPDWMVACASAGTPERRGLLEAGFLPIRPLAPRIVVRDFRGDPEFDLTDGTGWRWSLGDLEVF